MHGRLGQVKARAARLTLSNTMFGVDEWENKPFSLIATAINTRDNTWILMKGLKYNQFWIKLIKIYVIRVIIILYLIHRRDFVNYYSY